LENVDQDTFDPVQDCFAEMIIDGTGEGGITTDSYSKSIFIFAPNDFHPAQVGFLNDPSLRLGENPPFEDLREMTLDHFSEDATIILRPKVFVFNDMSSTLNSLNDIIFEDKDELSSITIDHYLEVFAPINAYEQLSMEIDSSNIETIDHPTDQMFISEERNFEENVREFLFGQPFILNNTTTILNSIKYKISPLTWDDLQSIEINKLTENIHQTIDESLEFQVVETDEFYVGNPFIISKSKLNDKTVQLTGRNITDRAIGYVGQPSFGLSPAGVGTVLNDTMVLLNDSQELTIIF
jgi:hypothetical protein